MRFEPVTDTIGAEVTGVDLAETRSTELTLEIDHALATYGVLFFRDQELTPNEHVAIGERFGELHIHPYERNPGGAIEAVVELDSDGSGQSRLAPPWHADATFAKALEHRVDVRTDRQVPAQGVDGRSRG